MLLSHVWGVKSRGGEHVDLRTSGSCSHNEETIILLQWEKSFIMVSSQLQLLQAGQCRFLWGPQWRDRMLTLHFGLSCCPKRALWAQVYEQTTKEKNQQHFDLSYPIRFIWRRIGHLLLWELKWWWFQQPRGLPLPKIQAAGTEVMFASQLAHIQLCGGGGRNTKLQDSLSPSASKDKVSHRRKSDTGHPSWSAVPIAIRTTNRTECLLDKVLTLFVEELGPTEMPGCGYLEECGN